MKAPLASMVVPALIYACCQTQFNHRVLRKWLNWATKTRLARDAAAVYNNTDSRTICHRILVGGFSVSP